MRFAVCIPVHGFIPYANKLDYLKHVLSVVEKSNIEAVFVEDHFRLPRNEIEASEGMPGVDEPLEAWTTLAAMAAITNRVKLGTEVTPMTLRHPGILAKQSANVDVLSNGRLILGAGAGWYKREFITQGIAFEPKKDRFERVREALEVVKLLWTLDTVDYSGKYYQLRGAFVAPKPMTKPHPPIWLGGFSEMMLKLVAKYGNGWINATNAPPKDVEIQKRKLNQLLSEAGRKEDEITVAVPLMTIVSKNYSDAKDKASRYIERGKFDKTLRFFSNTVEYGLVGTPETCIERIKSYEAAGVDYIIFDVRPPSNALPTLQLVINDVIPSFS